ncbi:hypothetical protein F0562_005620 [Nyssa sinensis]|uniref:Retrotransposon Copia-like N-terminal domain-containing protein n=1 Tax=Nyssa sinensis TaxID=561372 RepID=A0A5J5APA1_9ASTE|nr:hypothetical protein F0562_005620 [Nyssa sinensis]
MELSATSWGSGMMMLEQAKEELQILEIQHPNRFDYLKLELKSFILLLQSQNLGPNSISLPTSSTATTQASSTSKKRKKCSAGVQRLKKMARGGQNNNNNRFQPLTPLSFGSTSAPKQVSMENLSSPFFLHSDDHPSLVFVSHSLTGSNYNTWSCAMLMALNAKNKLGFVDGSISRPNPNDPAVGLWSRCNSMVTSWLLNAISKEIGDSLLYLNSAHAIWTNLHNRFRQSNAPCIFQFKQQLQGLS